MHFIYSIRNKSTQIHKKQICTQFISLYFFSLYLSLSLSLCIQLISSLLSLPLSEELIDEREKNHRHPPSLLSHSAPSHTPPEQLDWNLYLFFLSLKTNGWLEPLATFKQTVEQSCSPLSSS
jgi:hypothetical protein